MRNPFVLILFILFLVGCDKDPSSTNDNPSSLSPPSWIIGTWQYRDDLIDMTITWTFSSNDIVYKHTMPGLDSTLNFKDIPQTQLADESSDSLYTVTFTDTDAIVEFLFEKISSDLLNHAVIYNDSLMGRMQFKKQ